MRKVTEWSSNELETFGSALGRGREALAAARALGVKQRSGRFESYLALLEDAKAIAFPTEFPWAGDPAKQAIFYEATSQVAQLNAAADLWPSLPPRVVRHKLRKALAGQPLPDPAVEADRQARDILLEFTCASLLRRVGFKVEMTVEREDVRARCRGLPDLIVECKRPAEMSGLASAFARSDEQLAERCCGSDVGMVVIGIDRVLNDVPIMPVVQTHAGLEEWFTRRLAALLQQIAAGDRHGNGRASGARPSRLLGALAVIPVFIADEGMIFVAQQLGFCPLGPITAGTDRLLARFSGEPQAAAATTRRLLRMRGGYLGWTAPSPDEPPWPSFT